MHGELIHILMDMSMICMSYLLHQMNRKHTVKEFRDLFYSVYITILYFLEKYIIPYSCGFFNRVVSYSSLFLLFLLSHIILGLYTPKI